MLTLVNLGCKWVSITGLFKRNRGECPKNEAEYMVEKTELTPAIQITSPEGLDHFHCWFCRYINWARQHYLFERKSPWFFFFRGWLKGYNFQTHNTRISVSWLANSTYLWNETTVLFRNENTVQFKTYDWIKEGSVSFQPSTNLGSPRALSDWKRWALEEHTGGQS